MWDGIELSRHVKVSRGVPGAKDIDDLHAAGIRTVLDLRGDGEFAKDAPEPAEEAALLAARGIAYKRRPLPFSGFTEADLDEIGGVLREADKPVLVHCASGKRAGMVALAHTCIEAGVPGEEMLEMARSLDVVFGNPEQQHMFARYVNV
ncbi:MAG: tyrosine-protein phosphatase, partial [Acetobacteraceae bacterium]